VTAAELPDDHPRANATMVCRVPVSRLRANPDNIRTDLGDLRELTESIRYEGVLVALMAEDHGSHMVILHGHRRWAAAQLAGVTRVPVVVVDEHDPVDAVMVMLAEDKKEPVDPADKRRAIRKLHDQHGVSWRVIAERLGMPVSRVMSLAGKPAAAPTPEGGRHRSDRPRRPSITPTVVHQILTRFDEGELVPTDVVEELRQLIGDWEPAPKAGQR
jgi:ParB/RepB/Spo0J family partition protein